MKIMENCSSCSLQSKTHTQTHHIYHDSSCCTSKYLQYIAVVRVCVYCTFGNGPIDCDVHTLVAEVAITLEHEDQRGPSKQDASEAQTLQQA